MPYFETLLVQIQEKVKFLQKLGCHFLDKKKKCNFIQKVSGKLINDYPQKF